MKYQLPDENTPGYLRRDKKRLAFYAARGEDSADALVDWLSEYVIAEDVAQAIMDASKAEIQELIDKLTGIELPDPKELEGIENG